MSEEGKRPPGTLNIIEALDEAFLRPGIRHLEAEGDTFCFQHVRGNWHFRFRRGYGSWKEYNRPQLHELYRDLWFTLIK